MYVVLPLGPCCHLLTRKQEGQIENLQKLRATLELVKQSTNNIYKDIQTVHLNNQQIMQLAHTTAKLLDNLE